jgi:hypothetical protein
MKSRSSTGVGQKIDLEYNIETMRITDAGGDDNGYNKPQSSIMESIKAKAVAKSADDLEGNTKWEKPTGTPAWDYQAGGAEPKSDDTEKVTADVQSAKLKQMLAGIKKG